MHTVAAAGTGGQVGKAVLRVGEEVGGAGLVGSRGEPRAPGHLLCLGLSQGRGQTHVDPSPASAGVCWDLGRVKGLWL